jgi:hypothetical protein
MCTPPPRACAWILFQTYWRALCKNAHWLCPLHVLCTMGGGGGKRGSGWVRPRRRSIKPLHAADDPPEADSFTRASPSRTSRAWFGTEGLKQIALLLWLPDYKHVFEMEYQINEEACGQGFQLPPTTYRMRLKGEAAEAYDMRCWRHRRDEMAIALHANNQMRWSPSILARSVSYFCSASKRIQAEETRYIMAGSIMAGAACRLCGASHMHPLDLLLPCCPFSLRAHNLFLSQSASSIYLPTDPVCAQPKTPCFKWHDMDNAALNA